MRSRTKIHAQNKSDKTFLSDFFASDMVPMSYSDKSKSGVDVSKKAILTEKSACALDTANKELGSGRNFSWFMRVWCGTQ